MSEDAVGRLGGWVVGWLVVVFLGGWVGGWVMGLGWVVRCGGGGGGGGGVWHLLKAAAVPAAAAAASPPSPVPLPALPSPPFRFVNSRFAVFST
jgi:hypothetical protein